MILSAKGDLRIEVVADIGFGDVPIAATAAFELKPLAAASAVAPGKPAGPAVENVPAPEKDAQVPTVRVGPVALSAGGGRRHRKRRSRRGPRRAPMPEALGKYRALASTASASCRLDAGYTGASAGKIAVTGKARAGMASVERSVSVDLRAVVARARETAMRWLARLRGAGDDA